MHSEWYLQRNEVIINEIQQAIDHGLVFERKNQYRSKNGTLNSSMGPYYSFSQEEEVYIGLSEFPKSSPVLQAKFHLLFAQWFTTNYPRQRSVPSLFYGVLINKEGEEAGLVYEDISCEGKFEVTSDANREETSELNPDNEITLRQIIPLQVKANGKERIVDATALIPSIIFKCAVSNKESPWSLLRYRKDEQQLPTVIYPRIIT